MRKKIEASDIQEMWEKVNKGITVKEVTSEYGISREWYYQKCSELGLKTQQKLEDAIDIAEITKIKTIRELARLLDIDIQSVYQYSNPNKDTETNKKRMSYLKNHSPDKFQEAIFMTILNYYKLTPIELIKRLNTPV